VYYSYFHKHAFIKKYDVRSSEIKKDLATEIITLYDEITAKQQMTDGLPPVPPSEPINIKADQESSVKADELSQLVEDSKSIEAVRVIKISIMAQILEIIDLLVILKQELEKACASQVINPVIVIAKIVKAAKKVATC
jgi:hypothetical protein